MVDPGGDRDALDRDVLPADEFQDVHLPMNRHFLEATVRFAEIPPEGGRRQPIRIPEKFGAGRRIPGDDEKPHFPVRLEV